MKMAPGFFAKLGEIAKKVYSTGKKIAKGVAKYGVPIVKGIAQGLTGLTMIPSKQTQAAGNGLTAGLRAMQPIISRLTGE